jgi:hypothetical protein
MERTLSARERERERTLSARERERERTLSAREREREGPLRYIDVRDPAPRPVRKDVSTSVQAQRASAASACSLPREQSGLAPTLFASSIHHHT